MNEQLVSLIGMMTLLLHAKLPECRVSWEVNEYGTLVVCVDLIVGEKNHHIIDYINPICVLDGAGLVAVRRATWMAEELEKLKSP